MDRPTMTLGYAIDVLTDAHTRADAAVGFVVEMTPGSMDYSGRSPEEYIEAWRVLRIACCKDVEPPRRKE